MEVLTLLLVVVALAVAGLALRRADVVERRSKAWLRGGTDSSTSGPPAATAAPGSAAAASPYGASAPAASAPGAAAAGAGASRVPTGPVAGALNRVAVVRFDAFEDVGGRQSFSAAIVDDSGRGLVLTAIHGRSETRSYVKQVPVGAESGQRELSPEEQQAVATALRAGRP